MTVVFVATKAMEPSMAVFDDEPVKKPAEYTIGQDLSLLSVDELEERIAMLQDEIARLEDEKRAKSDSKSAAESFFKS